MGTGIYKGGINHYRSISDNLPKVANSYHFAHGYFGEHGDSTKERTRHIESSNPLKTAKDFYEKLTYGAIEKSLPNGKGKIAKLKDGTIITYREISSSDGSPAVDINIKKSTNSNGVKQQKIHFTKKGRLK